MHKHHVTALDPDLAKALFDIVVIGDDSVVQHHLYDDCYDRGSFPLTLDGTSVVSLYSNRDSTEVTVHYEPRGTEVDFRIAYRYMEVTYTYEPYNGDVPPADWEDQECPDSWFEPWGDYL